VGTTTYVLSRHLEPVPFGVPGELYLGGASVARGYCRRPDMTAERFVPDPFSAEPGARMYRTGDMARLLPDGILDFIGRRDHQVKIRGFRVELGEIETVLADAPGVREVAVLARSGSAGASGAGSSAAPADAAVDAVTRNPLVGYVVMDEGVEADVDRLREHLRRQLPGYMVPHRILVLDEMPRTTSGKLDRRALPEPGVQEAPVVKVESGPRTATEQRLVPIWCEILSRDRISIYDSFFELGGHSLMAAQLRSRLRSRLGVDLDLRRLFDEPTIAGLARIIDESGGVQEVSEGPGLIADAFDEEVI